jgi:hypothetical protein
MALSELPMGSKYFDTSEKLKTKPVSRNDATTQREAKQKSWLIVKTGETAWWCYP